MDQQKAWKNQLKGRNNAEAKHTHGEEKLHTLLVKHYNDYLDRKSCRHGRGVFIYFFEKKNLYGELWKNLSNFGYYIKMTFVKFFQSSLQRYFFESRHG